MKPVKFHHQVALYILGGIAIGYTLNHVIPTTPERPGVIVVPDSCCLEPAPDLGNSNSLGNPLKRMEEETKKYEEELKKLETETKIRTMEYEINSLKLQH